MALYQKIASITMILAVTMAALYGGAMAQSSGCNSVLVTLSPCLNYLSGNTSTPSSGCCGQLAYVVQLQPLCLCQVINGSGSPFGLNINHTQALMLPSACNVQTPPTSLCNAGSPGNSPSGSPDVSPIRFATIPFVFWLLVFMYAMFL